MKVLFLGDIVGRSARKLVIEQVPLLRDRFGLDLVVANCENAAAGFGITQQIVSDLLEAGIDCLTGGNHSFDQKDSRAVFDEEPRLLRPLNFPKAVPGRGIAAFKTARGKRAVIINAMGRVFMNPLDDPFAAVEQALGTNKLGRSADFILIDFHGEATSEKMAMGHFADGRASLVVGTHSHVPTADTQILPGGTAFQTDAGMCGDYDSVIGMEKDEPLRRFSGKLPGGRFTPALGAPTLCGVFVESDDATGLARTVCPVRIGGRLRETLPDHPAHQPA